MEEVNEGDQEQEGAEEPEFEIEGGEQQIEEDGDQLTQEQIQQMLMMQ